MTEIPDIQITLSKQLRSTSKRNVANQP